MSGAIALTGARGRDAALSTHAQPPACRDLQLFQDGLQRPAERQEVRSGICDGERMAVAPGAELGLAFEAYAPQTVRSRAPSSGAAIGGLRLSIDRSRRRPHRPLRGPPVVVAGSLIT